MPARLMSQADSNPRGCSKRKPLNATGVWKRVLAGAGAISLSACGGGGSGFVSTPPPPQSPPPAAAPTSSAVEIFASPATQEFAVVGTGDALRIRYDAAAGKYEVMAGGQAWKALVDDPTSAPLPGNPNTIFVMSGSAQGQSYFTIRAHHSYSEPEFKYLYSNLAAWNDGPLSGFTAFGMATPAGGVPTVGTATYQGLIEGSSTETYPNPWGYGGDDRINGSIGGQISLSFNFQSGGLAGQISPTLYLETKSVLPTLSFTNTVYSAGSTTFSGAFATSLGGANGFSGRFTGPSAQELIGQLTFPYLSPVDGKAQQGQGAFIAKR